MDVPVRGPVKIRVVDHKRSPSPWRLPFRARSQVSEKVDERKEREPPSGRKEVAERLLGQELVRCQRHAFDSTPADPERLAPTRSPDDVAVHLKPCEPGRSAVDEGAPT